MKSPLFLALALASTLFTACEPKPIRESNTPVSAETEAIIDSAQQAEKQQAGQSSATYECPMNCEGSRSDKPGKCPVCGMDLEKKA